MRTFAMGIAAFLLIGTAATLVSAASDEAELITDPVTIKVIEHATTDKVINVGKKGDSTGDILTFHNSVFNSANKKKIGRDQGVCIRIDPKQGSWECRWITYLKKGAITVEGPVFDKKDTTLAITGGRGTYRNARGTMDIRSRHGGSEYAFTFHIEP
jgi:allene oxide cyclase